MPSSNALNLPPRGVLVPSAAMDPRPGRYSRSPGRPRGKQRLGEGWEREAEGTEEWSVACPWGGSTFAELR